MVGLTVNRVFGLCAAGILLAGCAISIEPLGKKPEPAPSVEPEPVALATTPVEVAPEPISNAVTVSSASAAPPPVPTETTTETVAGTVEIPACGTPGGPACETITPVAASPFGGGFGAEGGEGGDSGGGGGGGGWR